MGDGAVKETGSVVRGRRILKTAADGGLVWLRRKQCAPDSRALWDRVERGRAGLPGWL